jgi:hypothetical protein
MKKGRRVDRKIHSLRRTSFVEERTGECAARARHVAREVIGGAIESEEGYRQAIGGFLPTATEVRGRERIVFAVPTWCGLPPLPEGYFYKGGAARLALGRAVAVAMGTPRDLDIVRFGWRWTTHDTRLSRELMPLDFERGWGVEVCVDLATYLATRDLSVNEVVFGHGEVVASPVAVLDTIGGVLRPCRYARGSIHHPPTLRGGTVAKMLRLRAEGRVDGAVWNLVGVPDDQPIEPFDLAVQLDKSFARSEAVAREFVRQCAEVGLVVLDDTDPGWFEDGVAQMVRGVFDPATFFRNIPSDLLNRVLG